jgi:hypothetical protein
MNLRAQRLFRINGIALVAIGLFFSSALISFAAPAAPAGFTVNDSRSSCVIDLSWNQTGAADHYTLTGVTSINPPQSFNITTLKTAAGTVITAPLPGPTALKYLDTNIWNVASGKTGLIVDPGTTRQRYTLSACDSANDCVPVTANGPFTTPTLPTPGTPTTLSGIGTSTNRLAFSFRAPAGSLSAKFPTYGGFTVDRTSVPASTYSRVYKFADGETTSFDYIELVAGSSIVYTYTFRFFESDEFCTPTTRASNVALSSPLTVTIPRAPSTLSATYNKASGDVNLAWTDMNDTANRTSYMILRNTKNEFDANTTGNLRELTPRPAGTATSFVDSTVEQNLTYHYQVRTCKKDATTGAEGCSLPAYDSIFTSPSPASNIQATIVYSSSTAKTSDVFLTWTEHAPGVSVFRYNGATVRTVPCATGQCRDLNVPWSATPYMYTVGDPIDTEASTSMTVNLNIAKVLSGNLWSATGDAAPDHGVGWINVNSDSLTEEGISFNPAARYSVQVDSNGLMSGLGWASVESISGILHGYGWVGFSGQKLTGCPSEPCEARLGADNKMAGWAKLLSADTNEEPPRSTYDGWISLNQKPSESVSYGVLFDALTEKLNGQVWGDAVLGWAESFLTLVGTTETTVLDCPTNIATVPAQTTDTTIGLRWTNPEAYDSLSLSRALYGTTVRSTLLSVNAPTPMPTAHNDTGPLKPSTQYTYTFNATKGADSCSATFNPTTLPPVTPTEGYTLTCVPGTGSVALSWTGSLLYPHAIDLIDITDAASEADWDTLGDTTLSSSIPPYVAPGSYSHTNLQSGKTYTYFVRATYVGGPNTGVRIPYPPVSCTVIGTPTDDTPLLNAYGNQSPSAIHLTWKDNSYYKHNWEFQWVKLTPQKPTSLGAVAQGASQVQLTWTNNTNHATLGDADKGPFYHVWERSSAASIDTAFLPGDTTVTSRTLEVLADRGTSGTQTGYTVTDAAVVGGTRYFYRVKACSYVTVDLVNHVPNQTIVPTTIVCSDYDKPGNYVSVTPAVAVEKARTAWNVVRDAGASLIDAVRSLFSENTTAIEEASAQYAGPINLTAFFERNTQPLQFDLNAATYFHTSRAAKSVYIYRIRATYASNPPGKTVPFSLWSNEAAGKTLPDGECSSQVVPIKVCSRNSYCSGGTGQKITCIGDPDSPYLPKSECSVAIDCRNVGTSRTSFEEIRP